MTKYTLPLTIIFLGIIVATLHAIALSQFLYWQLPWFDVLMHFLGGLLVSLFGIWTLMKYSDVYKNMHKGLLLFRKSVV